MQRKEVDLNIDTIRPSPSSIVSMVWSLSRDKQPLFVYVYV